MKKKFQLKMIGWIYQSNFSPILWHPKRDWAGRDPETLFPNLLNFSSAVKDSLLGRSKGDLKDINITKTVMGDATCLISSGPTTFLLILGYGVYNYELDLYIAKQHLTLETKYSTELKDWNGNRNIFNNVFFKSIYNELIECFSRKHASLNKELTYENIKILGKDSISISRNFIVNDQSIGTSYLGSVIYQNFGNNLNGWEFIGKSKPKIKKNKINLFNKSIEPYGAKAYYKVNTRPEHMIFTLEFSKQKDDCSTSHSGFIANLCGSIDDQICGAGIRINNQESQIESYWWGKMMHGPNNIEYLSKLKAWNKLEIILTSNEIIHILNNENISRIPRSKSGPNLGGSYSNQQCFRTGRYIFLSVHHNENEISHYHVKNIQVARLAGTSR